MQLLLVILPYQSRTISLSHPTATSKLQWIFRWVTYHSPRKETCRLEVLTPPWINFSKPSSLHQRTGRCRLGLEHRGKWQFFDYHFLTRNSKFGKNPWRTIIKKKRRSSTEYQKAIHRKQHYYSAHTCVFPSSVQLA